MDPIYKKQNALETKYKYNQYSDDHTAFKIVREEVRFQHQQLNSRVGAYVASQSFLVTAMMAAQRGGNCSNELKWVSLIAVPAIGIFISVCILFAIWGAWNRIQSQRVIMDSFTALRENLIAQDGKYLAHYGGMIYAWAMPFAFIVFWIFSAITLWKQT